MSTSQVHLPAIY